MIYKRRKYIRDEVTQTVGGTYKLDLPERGKLQMLWLRFYAPQVSGFGQGGGDWRLIDKISKIEVIGNGSTIIKSITGKVAQSIGWANDGIVAPDVWKNYATAGHWCFIPIYFGRDSGDTEYFLDLADWDSVELQITNTAAAATFSSITGSVVATFLEPEAMVGTPLGYFRTEEWRNWTTVQNATEYLSLPTELQIRRIMMQVIPDLDANFMYETGMWNTAYRLYLGLKTGAVEMFNGPISDLMRASGYDVGRETITTGAAYNTADKGFDMGIGYTYGAVPGAGSQDGAVAAGVPTIEAVQTSATQKAEAYEADMLVQMICKGVCYHNVLSVFQALGDLESNYIDPRVDDQVLMNVQTRDSASAADGTIRVILERLVRR